MKTVIIFMAVWTVLSIIAAFSGGYIIGHLKGGRNNRTDA